MKTNANKQLFATLFKKYRLQSQFETLAELASALAEEGLVYEESLYSHWQKGRKIPTRTTLLRIIKLFIKRGGVSTIYEVNNLLASAGQGYLTDQEANTLPKKNFLQTVPQLVPKEVNVSTTITNENPSVLASTGQKSSSSSALDIFILVLIYVLLTFWWWGSPLLKESIGGRFWGDFPSSYSIIAFVGSVYGLVVAKRWEKDNNKVSKAIKMFSFGLLCQVFGQLTYVFYALTLHISTPYPSIGDVGYFGSIFFYIYGVWLLGKAAGVRIAKHTLQSVIWAMSIPLGVLFCSYSLFLANYTFNWTNSLKILLDFGYPLGESIYISLALVVYFLGSSKLGKGMRNKVLFILCALMMQYIADYTFLYQADRGTWSVGGINDYMYLVAYFLMTFAILQFQTVFDEITIKEKMEVI